MDPLASVSFCDFYFVEAFLFFLRLKRHHVQYFILVASPDPCSLINWLKSPTFNELSWRYGKVWRFNERFNKLSRFFNEVILLYLKRLNLRVTIVVSLMSKYVLFSTQVVTNLSSRSIYYHADRWSCNWLCVRFSVFLKHLMDKYGMKWISQNVIIRTSIINFWPDITGNSKWPPQITDSSNPTNKKSYNSVRSTDIELNLDVVVAESRRYSKY